MPGGLQDLSGQTVYESTVARWTLSLDETTTITADSTVGKDTPGHSPRWRSSSPSVVVVSSVLITQSSSSAGNRSSGG